MHLTRYRTYASVFIALLLFTGLTVLAWTQDLGRPGNISVGLVIAVVKASLVALFFMHLKHDAKVDLSIRVFALFPIALFMILAVAVLPDIGFRIGDQDSVRNENHRQNRPAWTLVPHGHADGGSKHSNH